MVDPTAEINLRSYGGMNDIAAELWRKFLRLYADKFEAFDYNVRLGQGLDPGPVVSDEMRRMWYMVTTKRVDAIANRENQTWVLEVEPRPSLRTLGQVVGYIGLLGKFYPARAVVVGAIICEYIGYDMFGLFKGQNHLIFQFQPGKQPNLPPQFLPSVAGPGYTQQTQ